ncbi:ABC transporter ATP-binding protein/permease [Polynucleobacter sp. AP-Sving-400A-A2]|uniref:ATP-binding cassette domain-containing protein n=1 Tax=Polynucleobacter sp. AP-Sving-400A-A2 TaxID=2081049 RepID=UPI001BFD05E0|nr:ABC transporter ATP-binding protein/permease [Polynucleobacter sp. AP-Sving-400A-A2]QWE14860.1 ABC transporter ATP-binding protein/permease [Polynucleobacter sp. AP-Sving-400A-A2]
MHTLNALKFFLCNLSYGRKKQLILLVALNVTSSAFELISIGAIGPLMLALMSPDIPFGYISKINIAYYFNITAAKDIVLPIVICFILLVSMSGLVRILALYAGTKFSFSLGAEISTACFRAYLHKPYINIIDDHSSEIINNIFVNVNLLIYQVINPLTLIFSGLSLIISLCLLIIFIYPFNSILAFLFLFIIYISIYMMNKKKFIDNGQRLNAESTKTLKALQEAIGGIRDIIIDSSQNTFLRIHAAADSTLREVQGNSQFISAVPRVAVEVVAIISIAIIGYFLSNGAEMILALPTLAVLVMIGQRLLPSLQQCYIAVNSINGTLLPLIKINELLKLNREIANDDKVSSPLKFSGSIKLNNIELKLGKLDQVILSDINLEIFKGERIGIIGKTGSGKSTLVDVIMGLLLPTSGKVEIDSVALNSKNIKSWRSIVAHVPQSIFLTDGSIKENITFGIPESEISVEKVLSSAKQAELMDFIDVAPAGIDAMIGERGAFLSGGQKQRVGIARALYKSSQILIFDEATSALDSSVENSVMNCIYSLDMCFTIIVIAHRLSTLRGCSRIIEMERGRVKRIGTYAEMIEKK